MSSGFDEKTVALFPGQGSISSGAGRVWCETSAWTVVVEISEAAGVDVAALLLETPDEELVRTDRAQLATFALSMVGWRDYVANASPPRFVAGHSLGELSALVAAGVVSLADGASLVAARGQAMRLASEASPGSMVALMGPTDDALANLAAIPDLWIANINGPGQLVVSGTPAALSDLQLRARDLGWRRATPLFVGGAFHSPLMSAAQPALDTALSKVSWLPTEFTVGANVDGVWHRGDADWERLVQQQLTAPVQFYDLITALPREVENVVEMPPAGVLVGLTKRIRDFAQLVPWSAPSLGSSS